MSKKGTKYGWGWFWLGTGVCCVVAILATEALPVRSLLALVAVAGLSYTTAAYQFGWFRAPMKIGAIPRAFIILGVIWGAMAFLTWRVWPQSFSVVIEWGQTRYDTNTEGTGMWAGDNKILHSATGVFFLRLRNLRNTSTLISQYYIDAKTKTGWKPLKAFNMASFYAALGGTNNKYFIASEPLFDRAISDHNLSPGESVRGWVLETCLPTADEIVKDVYRVRVIEASGEVFVSHPFTVVGPTEERMNSRIIVGNPLNTDGLQIDKSQCL